MAAGRGQGGLALWSAALPRASIPSIYQSAFGQAEHPAPQQGMPAYVGASINEHGQPYYHVLDEYQGYVAFALNNYNHHSSGAVTLPQGMGVVIKGVREPRGGDLVPIIQTGTQDGFFGVALIGDPMVDQNITVLLAPSLAVMSELAERQAGPASSWYVLYAPQQGWQATPTREQGEVMDILAKMTRGLRWGAIVGGAAALGLLALHTVRARKRSTA